MNRKDTRYLKRRADGLWLVQVVIPRVLQRKLGKEVIEKSLRTDDYRVAVRRRDEVLPIIRQSFERAKHGRLLDRNFKWVNRLVESDVAPERITIDDALSLAKAGENMLACTMLEKLMRLRRSEPDKFVSKPSGKLEFYRGGHRVVQDATGRWKKAGK